MIKILMVDDDIMMRLPYSALLTRKGYEVYTSETAVDILATIAHCSPDLILMDQQMPMVTGFEAIKKIKSHEDFRSIPIIFFSSVTNLSALAEEAGADNYVFKSSTPKHLSDVIESLVNR